MDTNELIIKPSLFAMRMGKYSQIPRYIYGFDRIAGMKKMILQHKMDGMDEIIAQNLKFAESASEAKGEKFDLNTLRQRIEENTKADIEEYLPILFNQALVMMVTVFDGFLLDSLEVITYKQPKVLLQLTKETEIPIIDVINTADYDALLNMIRQKALKKFDHLAIKDKVAVLRKIGVDTPGIFNFKFHNENPRKKFPKAEEMLISTYDKRHGIVHRDVLPIKTPDDLDYIAEFLSDLMMSFGWEMGRCFDLPTDFDLPKLVQETKNNPRSGTTAIAVDIEEPKDKK